MMHEEQMSLWNRAAGVLLWCFVLYVVVMVIWAALWFLARDFIYGLQTKWFTQLSPRDVDMAMYCGMAGAKLVGTFLFLIPYLAIKIVIRKTR